MGHKIAFSVRYPFPPRGTASAERMSPATLSAEAGAAADRRTHRLALAAAIATFLLLAVGGIVTSRDAGMVFSDWPLSNGSVNPEGWLDDADMLSEHGHRILGSLVGLLVILLAVRPQPRERRRWVRVLRWCALGGVIAQGALGGIRVLFNSGSLALLHGITGQLFFCVMIVLAYATSRDALQEPEAGPDAGRLRAAAIAMFFATFMQVILGAQLRHNLGPIDAHLLGALLVAGTVLWVLAVTLVGHGDRPALRRPALVLATLLLVQVALGLLTARALGADDTRGYETPLVALALPSMHQAAGALLLASALWLTRF